MPITAENILTLAQREWLDDVVVHGYLTLVCHQANGHFDNEQLMRSPKWHTWSSHWLSTNDDSSSWPPPAYLEARVDDVRHHLFPRHLSDHWVLLHLWKEEGQQGWRAEVFSGLPGYQALIDADWTSIKAGLLSISNEMDLGMVELDRPDNQPIQNNSNDCGVLVLCAARWRSNGWPIATLKSTNCPELRERMIFELENWRLV